MLILMETYSTFEFQGVGGSGTLHPQCIILKLCIIGPSAKLYFNGVDIVTDIASWLCIYASSNKVCSRVRYI